jgi:hypothetical protein
MNINIDSNLLAFAEKFALADNVTLEVWCERKLNGNIKRLMKDVAIDQINSAKVEELDTFVSAVTTVKETFEAGRLEKIQPSIIVDGQINML